MSSPTKLVVPVHRGGRCKHRGRVGLRPPSAGVGALSGDVTCSVEDTRYARSTDEEVPRTQPVSPRQLHSLASRLVAYQRPLSSFHHRPLAMRVELFVADVSGIALLLELGAAGTGPARIRLSSC